MPTIAEARALLGPLAEGKTDVEIEATRDRFMDFARAVVGACDAREQARGDNPINPKGRR
jgi:hypothetical protein